MNPAFLRSRGWVLLAVLLLHAAGVGVAWQLARPAGWSDLRAAPVRSLWLRPLPPVPPAPIQRPVGLRAPARPPVALRPVERVDPRPDTRAAITLPAPQTVAAPPTAPAPAQSASAAQPPALDLRYPGGARGRMGAPAGGPSAEDLQWADRLRHDPRANSPREGAEARMANALGARGWTVLEGLPDGGRMIRGPQGECFRIKPSIMTTLDPINERHRWIPAAVGDCSALEQGARRPARPN